MGCVQGYPRPCTPWGLQSRPSPKPQSPPKLRPLHLTKNCGRRPDQAARCSRAVRRLPSK